MNEIYIYGKVKRKQNLLRILANENNIYDMDSVPSVAIEYEPNILIEPEEFYKISDFSQSVYANDFIKDVVESVNYDQITQEELKKLTYICTIQNNIYFFQAISANYYIRKKWFSISELSLEENKPIITINDAADVIYNKTLDVIYFKKLSVANRIFKGLDQLYRQSTDLETQEFLDSDFLEVEGAYEITKVSIPNRKKIALIKDTLTRFTDVERQAIYDYTKDYGQVTFEDGKFKIETDEDLKYVLWGIEQRYYTTPIGGERRVANSVITI